MCPKGTSPYSFSGDGIETINPTVGRGLDSQGISIYKYISYKYISYKYVYIGWLSKCWFLDWVLIPRFHWGPLHKYLVGSPNLHFIKIHQQLTFVWEAQ